MVLHSIRVADFRKTLYIVLNPVAYESFLWLSRIWIPKQVQLRRTRLPNSNHSFFSAVMDQFANSNQSIGPIQTTSRRRVSLAVESDQVITARSSVYSISNWLDEQLRNPLATPMRSFHGYSNSTPQHNFTISQAVGRTKAQSSCS
jgi:hypothetical protein